MNSLLSFSKLSFVEPCDGDLACLHQDIPPVNAGARHWNSVHAGAGPLRTPRRVKAGSDASCSAVGSETSFVSRRPGRRYMLVQFGDISKTQSAS